MPRILHVQEKNPWLYLQSLEKQIVQTPIIDNSHWKILISSSFFSNHTNRYIFAYLNIPIHIDCFTDTDYHTRIFSYTLFCIQIKFTTNNLMNISKCIEHFMIYEHNPFWTIKHSKIFTVFHSKSLHSFTMTLSHWHLLTYKCTSTYIYLHIDEWTRSSELYSIHTQCNTATIHMSPFHW